MFQVLKLVNGGGGIKTLVRLTPTPECEHHVFIFYYVFLLQKSQVIRTFSYNCTQHILHTVLTAIHIY